MTIVYSGPGFSITAVDPSQPAGVKTAEEISRMSPAQRLDYTRQFDQSKMPANPYDVARATRDK